MKKLRMEIMQSRISTFSPALLWVVMTVSCITMSAGTNAATLPKDSDQRIELIFWDSVKDSTNAADYEAYLEVYPDGNFAPLAKARAQQYGSSNQGASTTPAPVTTAAPSAPQKPPSASPNPVAPTPASARTAGTSTRRFKLQPVEVPYDLIETSNIRDRPSAGAAIIRVLNLGEDIDVTDRVTDRNWYRIVFDDGSEGYIYGELIQPTASRKYNATPYQPEPAAPSKYQATPYLGPEPADSTLTDPQSAVPEPAQPVARVAIAAEPYADCLGCPEMVNIESGSYSMGSDSGLSSERPTKTVMITRPFGIGKFEVSVAEWRECYEAGGCSYEMPDDYATSPDAPARHLNWYDAQEYVSWLTQKTGKHYRLATEAEWEYAARGGAMTAFWWGRSMSVGRADCRGCGGTSDADQPAAVDAYAANSYGLYGVSGGVWEWTEDCWTSDHAASPTDGTADSGDNCTSRVLRSGSWRNVASYATVTSRLSFSAYVRYKDNGMRVVREL
jgi:formylglycine-generating enzyme required for sulfatase activity